MAKVVVIFLLLTTMLSDSLGKEPDLLVDVIRAIDRVIGYVDLNMEDVKADLLFGLAITKGQLRATRKNLNLYPKKLNRVKSIMGELYYLEEKCEAILNASRSKTSLMHNVYNKMYREMWRPERWSKSPAPRQLREKMGNTPISAAKGSVSLSAVLYDGSPNEAASDACLKEAMETYGGPICRVSQGCYQEELDQPFARGYPLTHRLLYVHIARQNGCLSLGLSGITKSTNVLVNDFCVDILNDALLIEKSAFPFYARDMFCEQVALCGLEGFQEFIRTKWIREILQWQRPMGCFGNNVELGNMLKHKSNSSARGLRKRYEEVMAYDCLMHFTGVAMAALAVNLRSLVDPRIFLI